MRHAEKPPVRKKNRHQTYSFLRVWRLWAIMSAQLKEDTLSKLLRPSQHTTVLRSWRRALDYANALSDSEYNFFAVRKSQRSEIAARDMAVVCFQPEQNLFQKLASLGIMGVLLRLPLEPPIRYCCDGPSGFRGGLNWAHMITERR